MARQRGTDEMTVDEANARSERREYLCNPHVPVVERMKSALDANDEALLEIGVNASTVKSFRLTLEHELRLVLATVNGGRVF